MNQISECRSVGVSECRGEARDRQPGPVMQLRWFEEALALASYLEGQGFSAEAGLVRQFARKVRPQRQAVRA